MKFEIICYICSIISLFGFIIFIKHYIWALMDQDKQKVIISIFAIFMCSFILIGTYLISNIHRFNHYNEAISNNYSIYLDGIEVDPNNINIYDYNFMIDDINQNIKLTKKQSNNNSICVPFIYMSN